MVLLMVPAKKEPALSRIQAKRKMEIHQASRL